MGQGGGLINLNGSIGTLFDSIVTLNTATGGGGIGGNGGDGQGGGVYNGGPSPRRRASRSSAAWSRFNRADGGARGTAVPPAWGKAAGCISRRAGLRPPTLGP